jgi:hypothetical protein
MSDAPSALNPAEPYLDWDPSDPGIGVPLIRFFAAQTGLRPEGTALIPLYLKAGWAAAAQRVLLHHSGRA